VSMVCVTCLELSVVDPKTRKNLAPPSFVIVDPDSVVPLGIIQVVGDVDDMSLRDSAISTRRYAGALGGKAIQGFVIRVDIRAATEAEQVQFYRVWPNQSMQALSSKTFPDLDSLRVSRRLHELSSTGANQPSELANSASTSAEYKAVESILERPTLRRSGSKEKSSVYGKPGLSLYVPAILLLVVLLLDGLVSVARGAPLLSLPQSVLLIGAALLLTVPAAIRYLR